jgi:hypothetical protein
MSTFKLDEDGDLEVINGQVTVLNRDGSAVVEETAQRLKLKLQTFLGEWFLDTRVGVPYFQYILEKGARPSVMREIFREIIVADEQVETLLELTLDFDPAARSLSVDFSAELADGLVLEFSDVILQGNR